MKVALFQYSPVFGEKRKNIERLLRYTEGMEFDILVLPELFATGYQFHHKAELKSLAERASDGITVSALCELAKAKDCLIVAGIAELSDGMVFNSAVCLTGDGVSGIYRKIHLFDYEKEIFDAGYEPPKVFSFKNIKVGVMICFDWIYPEVARSLAIQGAHIIAHPANLILPFCQTAMFARAVENRVFTVTANRTGEESRIKSRTCRFTGGSIVYSPKGEVLLHLNEDEERLAVVEICPSDALNKRITERNDLLADRRPDLYTLG